MAVDDESFYNIIGEEINRENILNEMINFYGLLREVGDTIVTDFNEGSEIRNILEAIAVVIYWLMETEDESSKTAFVNTAEGELLDMHGANPWIQQPRDLGTEATGYVTFKIPEAGTEDIVIPEDTTVVCEETGNYYVTESEIIIPVGETEATVSIICATEGEDGNVGTGEINIIDDEYLDIPEITVTNEEPITGGTDYEEDEEYRERLLNFIRRDDFGSLPYYIDLAENIDGVHDVLFVDDLDFTRKILVNGTGETLLTDVLECFSNLNNIVVSHTFTVDTPDYEDVSLFVDLTVDELLDESELRQIFIDMFQGGANVYGFEFDGYSIGETLISDSVYSAFDYYPGMNNISIYRVVNDSNVPLSDISVGETECLRLEQVVFNQTIGD